MSIGTPLGSRHGYDMFERPNGRVDAWRGSDWAGYAFPADAVIVGATDWVARREHEDAVHVATRHSALAHILGGCPDCVCEPVLCRNDDTGRSCEAVNCGACLHGCPEDECDMRAMAGAR